MIKTDRDTLPFWFFHERIFEVEPYECLQLNTSFIYYQLQGCQFGLLFIKKFRIHIKHSEE